MCFVLRECTCEMPISSSDIAHLKKVINFKRKTAHIPRIPVFGKRKKNSSKLKKKKFVLIHSTNQTFIIYKNSCEQTLSDDVTQSYVIKMCVRKTNIGLIWGNKLVDKSNQP